MVTAPQDRGLCFAPPWQGGVADAVGTDEFASLMTPLGPFEARPQLAVAVSGGADSLGLAVLLQDWARAEGGSLLALVVDHGLRPAAAREAAWVRSQLRELGVATKILRWRGGKPAGSLQAAAREARYRLLLEWCTANGILHLALGHHLEDQAETFLLRLARGSGLSGLSAMDPVRITSGTRLLRPLLDVPKARLLATLAARGLTWLEDPSNQDSKFARIRLRRLAPALAAEGLTAARLADTAAGLGRARAAVDASVARRLARHGFLHPGGVLHLAPAVFDGLADEAALRLLARGVTAIGGRRYGPRLSRLEGLYGRLRQDGFRAATLSGCRIAANRRGIWLHREAAKAPTADLRPGDSLHWDGRFQIALGKPPAGAGDTFILGSLGRAAHLQGLDTTRNVGILGLPAAALAAFPALRDEQGLVAVPHLAYIRPNWPAKFLKKCLFVPQNRLS